MNGVERGSSRNRMYALRTDAEVRAYLDFQHDGVDLRANYLAIMSVLRDQVSVGRMPVGPSDEPKLKSSLKLFGRIAFEDDDHELYGLISEITRLMENVEPRGRKR